MTVSVSSNEARNSLGRLLRLAQDENEAVVIKVRGEPTAVLVSYAEYEALAELRRARRAAEALELIRQARARVQERSGEIPPEEIYRQSGFGPQATDEILRADADTRQ